jgi:DUF1680 family protein
MAQTRLPAGAVTDLGGFLGRRLRLSAENYLKPFQVSHWTEMVESRTYKDWWWTGEQPGKWLHSAIAASETFQDKALRVQAERFLDRFVRAQESSGYLGITAPAVRTGRQPLRGMDAYELYFTLHALCAAWESWQNAPALAAARRLADYLVTRIGPGKAEFYPLPRPVTIAGHEVHYGLEGALLIDPVMRIYEHTREQRYLDWVLWVLASLDRWSNCDNFSKLDQVANGRLALNEIQPYVHAHTLHMVLMGALRLYRVNGDSSLLRKATGVWQSVAANYSYITGGVSTGEHYGKPHDLPNSGSVVETCASYSWILLNQALLELTGEAAHADAIERLMLNHVPAAQTIEGDGFRYHCPLNGWKPLNAWTGPDCCSSSGNLLLALLPGTFYGSAAEAVVVNQFVPSTMHASIQGQAVRLIQKHEFPVAEDVVIEVQPANPAVFEVKVRIPRWCEKPSLRVNGELSEALPGTYVSIRRQWSPGDRIVLNLPMAPVWVEGQHTNTGRIALTRGPVVYCLDTAWMDGETGSLLAGDRQGDDMPGLAGIAKPLRAVATPAEAMGPAFEGAVRLKNGERRNGMLVPFANLGRWHQSEAEKARGIRFRPEAADHRKQQPPSERNLPFAVWLRPA